MNNHLFGSLFILLIILSCSQGMNDSDQDKEEISAALKEFDDFPDSLFGGVQFNQPVAQSRRILENEGFILVDSSGVLNLERASDSCRIILPLHGKLDEAKVILRSKLALNAQNELMGILQREATETEENNGLEILSYDSKIRFKLSVFKQETMIRMSFERLLSK